MTPPNRPPAPAGAPDFDAWVAARAPALMRFAYVLTADEAAADEVVLEVLSSAYAGWSRLSGGDRVEDRLRSQVVRCYLRRAGRRRTMPAATGGAHPAWRGSDTGRSGLSGHTDDSRHCDESRPSRDDESSGRLDPEVLWERHRLLSPVVRAAATLRFYEGLHPAELAQAMGVRPRVARRAWDDALACLVPAASAGRDEGERVLAVRWVLQEYADTAPAPYTPAARAATRSGRRRRRRTAVALGAAAVFAVPVAWAVSSGDGPVLRPPTPSAEAQVGPPLDLSTWRWESWGGIQVRVPDSWGHGDLTQWCVTRGPDGPAVDLPEIVSTNALCSLNDYGRPTYTGGLVLRREADDLRLSRADVAPYATTRIHTIGGITLTVVDIDPAIGSAILESAEVVGRRDFNGCRPHRRRGAATRAVGPARALPLDRVRSVTSVSVCRYGLRGWSRPTLVSSRRLTGAAATEALAELREGGSGGPAARTGTRCPRVVPGFAVIELWQRDRASSLVVRYDPCAGHVVDDGVRARRIVGRTLDAALVPPWTGQGTRGGRDR